MGEHEALNMTVCYFKTVSSTLTGHAYIFNKSNGLQPYDDRQTLSSNQVTFACLSSQHSWGMSLNVSEL
jgi:hypothetical protein